MKCPSKAEAETLLSCWRKEQRKGKALQRELNCLFSHFMTNSLYWGEADLECCREGNSALQTALLKLC